MGFRTKLILSYAAIIFLTLLLALALVSFIVQQTQQAERDKTEQRLKRNTELVVESITSNNVLLTRNIPFYARLFDVRFLIVSQNGDVLLDTETTSGENLENKTIQEYHAAPRTGSTYRGNFVLNNVNYIYFAYPTFALPSSGASRTEPPMLIDLIMAVPEANLSFDWDSFLQGIAVAASIALLISIAAAYLIARNVARPLIRMTRASEEIARGNYNQVLEPAGKGEDEISRLGISFNRMSQEVARSQQTMRDFVANVSHELKTPLTSIQGFSQAILDGMVEDKPSLDRSVKVVYDEAARMRRLVDELLDLSRIESGQIEFQWRDIDLRSFIQQVAVKLEPLAEQKNIRFQMSLDAYIPQLNASGDRRNRTNASVRYQAGPLIWGDPDRLEQIFTNILDNSVKYSLENSEVKVELRLGQAGENSLQVPATTPAGSYYWAVINISNLGPLIPPEQLPRIFERFYKLDRSRARKKGDSTGLGLAIARELVEAHNGRVLVQSQPQADTLNYPYPVPPAEALTTFSIYLPLLALPSPIQVSETTPVLQNQLR